MPHPNVNSIHADAPPIAPMQPAQVFCEPSEALPASTAGAADANRAARETRAQNEKRAPNPPGRPLDEVMRAFREQRRLTKEEGSSNMVIRQILAKAGPGSLLSDMASQK